MVGVRVGQATGHRWAGKRVIAGQQTGHGWAGKQVMVGQAHGSWLGRHMGHGWASMLNLLTLSRYYSQR